MSGPGPEGDAEALRIFLRLIRPRPLADPYPLHTRLRDLAPFLPVRFPGVANGFLVSTFAGCSRLLRDPAFGPPTGAHLDALRPGWRQDAFTRCIYQSMPLLTGQSHRRQRQAASHHFSPRSVETHLEELGRVADTLLDQLAGLAPAVDLVEQLAVPFASLSLGRLLGIADDEAMRLGWLTRQASNVFDQFATASQHERTAAAGAELLQRVTVLVAGQGGSNDLLASLAGSGTGADEQEVAGAAMMLLIAGTDSPASLVGLGTQLLLDHPDQASLLRQRPDLAPRAVAEILRYEPPVQLVTRAALEPAELEGRPVPQGSLVFGLIAAANRDPAQVKEPAAFDVTREQGPSLTFAAGPHYCLGAHLAALQGEILFPRLLRRFPHLRPVGDPIYRTPGSTLRGLASLPLALS